MAARDRLLLASAARTASANSPDQENLGPLSAHILVIVTAVTSTPAVVTKIQGKDLTTGVYYDLLVAPAISTTGTYVFKIGPGIGQSANASAADFLPENWRVRMEHGNANSATYTVTAQLGK